MKPKKAITVEEAIAGPEARLVMDLPCETCGCEFWERVDLEGRLFYRCAGMWQATGDDCRRLRQIPVLKDPPPVANLVGEVESSFASSSRVVDGGSADYEVARKAMLADSDAVARLRGTEAQRNAVMDDARALKAISDARWASSPGPRPAPRPLKDYVEFFRGRR